MTTLPVREDRRPDLLPLVDATGGEFYGLGRLLGLRAGVLTELDPETGIPRLGERASGVFDPFAWRLHDLGRDAPSGDPDRRWAPQLVCDHGAEYEDPTPQDAPHGQPEWFTAANRSTRWFDGGHRVAIGPSLFRVTDSEDQRYAVALTSGKLDLGAAAAAGGADDLSAERAAELRRDGVAVGADSVSFGGRPGAAGGGGVAFFGGAAAAARAALLAGASADDALRAAQAVVTGGPPPTLSRGGGKTQDRGGAAGGGKNPKTQARKAPENHPAGYVRSSVGVVGLLGTFFVPEGQGGHDFTGREGTPIGPLPARHDAQFAMLDPSPPKSDGDGAKPTPSGGSTQERPGTGARVQKQPTPKTQGRAPAPPPSYLVGRVRFVPDDASAIPEGPGTLVKGAMWADRSRANQDTAVGHETCQWVPVVRVNAKQVTTGGLQPPRRWEPVSLPIPGPRGKEGKQGKQGKQGDPGPAGPRGEPGFQARSFENGEPCPTITLPPTKPDPISIPGTTGPGGQFQPFVSGGISFTPGRPTTGLGGPTTLPDVPPWGSLPGHRPRRGVHRFARHGFASVVNAVDRIVLGDGTAIAVAPGGAPGETNVARMALPLLGEPGGPLDLEGWTTLATYQARAMSSIVNAAFGGPGYLAANMAVVHRNTPGNPPTPSRIGAWWTPDPDDDEHPGALVVPAGSAAVELGVTLDPGLQTGLPAVQFEPRGEGRINLDTGATGATQERRGSIDARVRGTIGQRARDLEDGGPGYGWVHLYREHRGDGVRDEAPLLLLDNHLGRRRGQVSAPIMRDGDERFEVSAGGCVKSSSCCVHYAATDTEEANVFEIAKTDPATGRVIERILQMDRDTATLKLNGNVVSTSSTTLGGDLAGTIASATVAKIAGRTVLSSAPNNNDVLTWVASNTRWEPVAPSGGPWTTSGGEVQLTDPTKQVRFGTTSPQLLGSASATFDLAAGSPVQAAGSLSGKDASLAGGNATAGSATPGAAQGGSVVLFGGDAARLTSGSARGGNVRLFGGAGIGGGTKGYVEIGASASDRLAFFGVADVGKQTVAARTDNSGGTDQTNFPAAGVAYSQADENNFRATVAAAVAAIRTALVNYGLSA